MLILPHFNVDQLGGGPTVQSVRERGTLARADAVAQRARLEHAPNFQRVHPPRLWGSSPQPTNPWAKYCGACSSLVVNIARHEASWLHRDRVKARGEVRFFFIAVYWRKGQEGRYGSPTNTQLNCGCK